MRRRLSLLLGLRGRRRLGALLAVLMAVAVVAVLVVRASPPARPSVGSKPTASASGTATVQRHDLVETDTESGTIGYADPQTVYNRLSGTITWLPAVGQVIKPGQTLFRIDGEPVVLMGGSAPAYRDLDASDTPGADTEQLNRNLVRLGFDPDGIVIDDEWQPATTVGVELFQASLGEDETGSLSLGQVVFLPGEQVISARDGTVGSTGGGGGGSAAGSGAASAGASTSPAASDPEFVSLQRTTSPHGTTPVAASTRSAASGSCPPAADGPRRTTTTRTTTSSTTASCMTSTAPAATSKQRSPTAPAASDGSGELSQLTALLKAEAAQLKAATAALKAAKRSSSAGSPSASGSSPSKSSGSGSGSGGAATAILQTSSTQLIVTVDLSASSQSEAKLGAPVMVELPSGKTVDGTITAVSSVAQTSSSSGSGSAASGSGGTGASSTVPVTIKLKGHHRGTGINQASVSVNFAQAEAKHVLSVPVTALIATAGGGYAVQEANAPYARLAVTTGLFAAGDVQISGPGIHPGLRVTNSQG